MDHHETFHQIAKSNPFLLPVLQHTEGHHRGDQERPELSAAERQHPLHHNRRDHIHKEPASLRSDRGPDRQRLHRRQQAADAALRMREKRAHRCAQDREGKSMFNHDLINPFVID